MGEGRSINDASISNSLLNEVNKWAYLWLREPKRSAPKAVNIRSLSTMEMTNIPLIACSETIRLSASSAIHKQVIHAGFPKTEEDKYEENT